MRLTRTRWGGAPRTSYVAAASDPPPSRITLWSSLSLGRVASPPTTLVRGSISGRPTAGCWPLVLRKASRTSSGSPDSPPDSSPAPALRSRRSRSLFLAAICSRLTDPKVPVEACEASRDRPGRVDGPPSPRSGAPGGAARIAASSRSWASSRACCCASKASVVAGGSGYTESTPRRDAPSLAPRLAYLSREKAVSASGSTGGAAVPPPPAVELALSW
mmetsp:Transcript_28121/g.84059  ORF Transcript_28121/g.84059 Transcript_28121/m.84059 type:complete len:218 (-) Transcript_28121:568-1221(-)